MGILHVADIRKEYRLAALDEREVDPNPLRQFEKWFDDVLKSDIEEPNAMTLATATPDGRPSARIVLLKGFDEKGFVFFTNYDSRKGQQLAVNARAALVFFWKELERQVCVEGGVMKISAALSDEYFNSRPEGSRIGAWASPQSQVIPERRVLEQKVRQYQQLFSGKEAIPRPPYWGGYVVQPDRIEFWQGRGNRLHDRIQYTLLGERNWKIERLAP